MKLAVLLTLATLGQVHAATEFGGFNFHSTVDASQQDTLKSDITYLYQNPIKNPDQDFLSVAQISTADGLNMHNWLINRVRYIIGENYNLSDNSNIIGARYNFPNTPMPVYPKDPSTGNGGGTGTGSGGGSAPVKNPNVKTVMSNLGGAIYLSGKAQKVALGIKFDGTSVLLTSPRVGLLKVGEGLFFKGFLLNADPKAPANAIFRLSTLFHEARHSDGNGLHTGFLHDYCPTGHPYEGFAACEISGNGSYTVGAYSGRHLLKNCTACSPKEISALQANVLDSLNRIIPAASLNKSSSNIDVLKSLIAANNQIITVYKNNNSDGKFTEEIEKINKEIEDLNRQIADLDIAATSFMATSAPLYDSNPEGTWTKVSLDQSRAMMTKALKK